MKEEGRSPCSDSLRPTLKRASYAPRCCLAGLPGEYDDWLICMISSQIRHRIPGFDQVIQENDRDFADSGLKTASVIRVGRLAVVEGEILVGAIGQISLERLRQIKTRLAEWIISS